MQLRPNGNRAQLAQVRTHTHTNAYRSTNSNCKPLRNELHTRARHLNATPRHFAAKLHVN